MSCPGLPQYNIMWQSKLVDSYIKTSITEKILEEFLGKQNFHQIFMRYKYKEIKVNCLCHKLFLKKLSST